MQLSRRSLLPGEIDHELVWLSVSLGSFAIAALWFTLRLPWPRCIFHDLTGLPCLTCGATRAAIQFCHGNFVGAWKWNPLVFAGLCAISVFDVYAALVLVTRRPRLRIAQLTANEKNSMRVVVVAAMLLCAFAVRGTELYTSRYQSLPVLDWIESRSPLTESADVPPASDLARGLARAMPMLVTPTRR